MVWVCQMSKLYHWFFFFFFRHNKFNKCQTLHGTTHWALPVHYTFSDLDIVSRSHQCQKVLIDFLCVLIRLSRNIWKIVKYVKHVMICHYFLTFADIQGRSFMFSLIWQKLYRWLFHRHCSGEVFRTLHYYNLARESTDSYQVWRLWSSFKVTGVS